MTEQLPQKYHEVAQALVPYTGESSESTSHMALIRIDPPLPCFLCSQPASDALVAPAPEQLPGGGMSWLTFPICAGCEERQVHRQAAGAE